MSRASLVRRVLSITLTFGITSSAIAHPSADTTRRTAMSWEACDRFLFASEIAWQKLLDDERATSLDEILCDPALAADFDALARRYAPGFSSLDYRWAALKLRKQAEIARSRAARLRVPARLGKATALDAFRLRRAVQTVLDSGTYVEGLPATTPAS